MGADQSSPNSPQTNLKSQRDEDIPYTSYSISKPIDSGHKKDPRHEGSPRQDTPRHSPRLTLKGKSPLAQPKRERDPIADAKLGDIVVVAEGTSNKEEFTEAELRRLEDIPVFFPIMRGSLNIPNMRDPDNVDKMDPRQVLLLCTRYQEHLKQCAEAIAFDQNALCVRIKEIDFAIHTLNMMVTERQKKYAKYAEQIQKVQEVSSVLTRVKMHVDELLPLMERLNSVLPLEDQLEPFTMKPIK